MSDPYYSTLLHKADDHCEVTTVYRFRPDRRHPWLQRILFRMLDWLGAWDVKVTSTVSEVVIQSGKLYEFLDLHAIDSYRRTGQVSKRVIMGWRTFKKFAASQELNDMLSYQQVFDLPPINRPDSHYERAFYRGYRIYTFPWFAEGVVVIPNDL
jgi:hypothetical protein